MLNEKLREICDPQQHTLGVALQLARAYKEGHPSLDIDLAQLLPPRVGEEGLHLEPLVIERVLEIIDAVSKGNRVVNRIIHLIGHDNERIRSKAALLIGRRLGSAHWAAKAEKDQNHRVRANVIEALWGSTVPRTGDMLRRALRDSDNRVVGNAIYGIYLISKTEGVALLEELAREEDSGRRITAAWVMGKTEDRQFHSLLQMMIKDEEPRVRALAIKSLLRLKQAPQIATPPTPSGSTHPLV